MTTPTTLQLRRGTSAQIATFTGASGEVTPDMTNNRLVLHDGTTAGGHQQASKADLDAAIAAIPNGAGYDTVPDLNSATVPSGVNSVVTLGYYAAGDGGGTRYVRVSSAPSKPGYQTSDGGTVYWDLPDRSHINVKWLGAKGDASTDDLTAIEDSITALADQPSTGLPGGTVYFPTGEYHVSDTAIDLLNSRSISFKGEGSAMGLLYPASFLVLTATGTPSLVKLDGTQGIRFSHLGLSYNSTSYTGNLIDISTTSGSSVTSFTTFEDFYIGGIGGGAGPNSAGSCLLARNTLQTYLSRGFIHNAIYGVIGGITNGVDFNNLMVIDSVWFDNRLSGGPVVVGGQNWVIRNCAFEPPTATSGQPRGLITSALGMSGLVVETCNFADASHASGSWIDFVNNFGFGDPGLVQGLKITNNLFQGKAAMVILGSNCQGLEISGNQFYMPTVNAVPITGGSSAKKLMVWGNRILSLAGEGVGNIIDNQPTDRASLVDRNDGWGLSFGASGSNYVYLPGHRLMAWGTKTGVGTSASAVSFGVTFAAAPVVTATVDGAVSAQAASVANATTTGFSVYVASGTQSVNWIAIGTAA